MLDPKKGTPVRVNWPDERWSRIHGKTGTIVERRSRMRRVHGEWERLYAVDLGGPQLHILSEVHLELI